MEHKRYWLSLRERKAIVLFFALSFILCLLPYYVFFQPASILFTWKQDWADSLLVIEEDVTAPTPYNRFPSYKKQWQNKKEYNTNNAPIPCPINPNTADSLSLIQAGFPKVSVKGMLSYRRKGGRFKNQSDLKRVYQVETKLLERLSSCLVFTDDTSPEEKEDLPEEKYWFAFNPNTLSEDSLALLPLPKSSLKGIISFRSKGWSFRKAEDLKKLYGMSEDLFQEMQPYLILPQEETTEKPKSRKSKVNIQTANIQELDDLPCIGQVLAQRIVDYRQRLGGFANESQLKEVYGLRDSTWLCIRSFIEIDTVSLRKINLNKASQKELEQHPYLEKMHVKALLDYRKRKGQFGSIEELQVISEFNDYKRTYQKIKPYLTL